MSTNEHIERWRKLEEGVNRSWDQQKRTRISLDTVEFIVRIWLIASILAAGVALAIPGIRLTFGF